KRGTVPIGTAPLARSQAAEHAQARRGARGHLRLRRDRLAADRLCDAALLADLSIRNSSGLRPSFTRASSHFGRAPRPAQSSPEGPRYFGATFMPFRGCGRARPARALETPHACPSIRFSCVFRSCVFSASMRPMSSRSFKRASTVIVAKPKAVLAIVASDLSDLKVRGLD